MKLTEASIVFLGIALFGLVLVLLGQFLLKKEPDYKPYHGMRLIGGTQFFYGTFMFLREVL